MKFFVDNWLLILVAFASGAMLVWPMVRKGGTGSSVPSSEAVRLINREKGVLVDVSEPNEFAAGHAAGARNIPFGQLEGSKELPTNKSWPVLLMCPTGARASRAAGILRKAGYEKAVAVSGGTAGWRDAQLPTERAAADAEKTAKVEKAEKADKAEKAGKASSVEAAEKSA